MYYKELQYILFDHVILSDGEVCIICNDIWATEDHRFRSKTVRPLDLYDYLVSELQCSWNPYFSGAHYDVLLIKTPFFPHTQTVSIAVVRNASVTYKP